MASFFRADDEFIYLDNCDSAEFCIPEYYFTAAGGFAEDLGNKIHAFGVFKVKFLEKKSVIKESILNLPTWTDFFVYSKETRIESMMEDDGNKSEKCVVLTYLKGEKIMNSFIVENSTNVQTFVDFVMKGKIPSFTPYEKAIALWEKNMEINNTSLGVPSLIEEMILSSAYRYNKDQKKKFAHVIGKDPNMSQYDYKMVNVRQICQYTSTFAGLTFEDFDTMVTTSLNRTRTNGNEAYSPIEGILKL